MTGTMVIASWRLPAVVAVAVLMGGCTALGMGGEEIALEQPEPTAAPAPSGSPQSLGTLPGADAPPPAAPPSLDSTAASSPPSLEALRAITPSEPAPAGSPAPAPAASAPAPAPALAGPQFAALGETGLLSVFTTTEVGQKIERSDQLYAERAGQESLEYYRSGTRSAWQNPDTGNAGTITPMRTFQRDDGTYCRDFEQLLIAGGLTGRASGTACRQPDTSWRLVQN